MAAIIKYDDEMVRLYNFDRIEDRISIIFSESGIMILPMLTRENDTHFMSRVSNHNGRITILDDRLIKMMTQFNIPHRTSYMNVGQGYMAYDLNITDFRERLNNKIIA